MGVDLDEIQAFNACACDELVEGINRSMPTSNETPAVLRMR
jgi:hypothetical protein